MAASRYQVWTDGLTTTCILSRRYGVADMLAPKDHVGRPTKFALQTDDARRAQQYADELNHAYPADAQGS